MINFIISFVLLLASFTINIHSQNKQFYFEHILVRDGLPAVSVTSLFEDKFGFIWVGTSGGIVKYDGYQLEQIKINKNNLFDDEVYSIKEDRKGQLWIATSSGLKKFDYVRKTFIPYDFAPHILKSSLKITFFYFDRNNNLWFINGTTGNWYRYNVAKYELSDLGPSGMNPQINNSFLSQSRQSELGKFAFLEDNNGNIWIGIDKNGLYKYIPQKDTLINFKNDPKEITSLGSNSILKIIQDSQGSIWIGTDGGGLNLYDYQNNSFERLQQINNNLNSIINNTVQSIYADKKGFLWLTTPAGLDRLDPLRNEFIHFSKNGGGNNHLSTNWAMPLCEDALGNMWVINEDDVPEYFDYEKFSFTNCLSHPIIPGKYNPSAGFSCFLKDHSGNLWFGTWGGGINKIDPSKVVINNWEFLSDNGKIIGGSICSICEDANGNLAIRTYEGNLFILNSSREKISTYITGLKEFPYDGLPVSIFDGDGNLWLGAIGPKVIKFDMGTEKFKEYRIQISKDFKPNTQNRVRCIIDETDDKLLIGTLEGIVEFDKKNGVNHLYQIKNNISDDYELMTGFKDATNRIWLSTKNKGLYQYLPDKKEFIKPLDVNAEVLRFCEDRNQNLWLGTLTSGVFLMDKTSGIKESYSMTEGLPTNQVSDMAEDDEGNIWVLTLMQLQKLILKINRLKIMEL